VFLLLCVLNPAIRPGLAESAAWAELRFEDSQGVTVRELDPGRNYRAILRVENAPLSAFSHVSLDLEGPGEWPSLENGFSFSWHLDRGFYEPTGQALLSSGDCSLQSPSSTTHEWVFCFRLPDMSEAGLWAVTSSTGPEALTSAVSIRVLFSSYVSAEVGIDFQAPPGEMKIGDPSPLSLTVACNDDADLLVSSDGLHGDLGQDLPPSTIVIDDDALWGEVPERGSQPITAQGGSSDRIAVSGGPERALNLYPYFSCPEYQMDGVSVSGTLTVDLVPADEVEDSAAPEITNVLLRSPGSSNLIAPTSSIIAEAYVSDDLGVHSLVFSVDTGQDSMRKQVLWLGNQKHQASFEISAVEGHELSLSVEAVDVGGHSSTADRTQVVGERGGVSGVYVGDLEIWEDDYFEDLYDIFPSFPSDGIARIYANISDATGATLHYERRFASHPEVLDEGTIGMTSVSSPVCPSLWGASIRVAPSENLTYWVTTAEGDSSERKWFKALPDVWNDHYGYGLLCSWTESGSPQSLLNMLSEVEGSFVIPINTWGQSSTDPPRYFYPFDDSDGLWDPEFEGGMTYSGFYDEWKRVCEEVDPGGEFYASSWFFYHRTWRDDAPPVPAPHSSEQMDRLTRKLGRIVASDPTWRALILDQEYASYHEVKGMIPLRDEWDDDSSGALESDEFEAHMVDDILGVLREYRSDTWYGGQPHLGYRWNGHTIPDDARLAASVNHFQHCDASGGTGWYFTQHFDSSVGRPLLSAGVSACASDLATDYTLHSTQDNKDTPTSWELGYAEQLLYAYLLNPHYVTNWVHGGWDGQADPGSTYSFDQEEKDFTRNIVERWNKVPYLSDMVYAYLPDGGSRPLGSRELGSKPSWLSFSADDGIYFSLSKELNSMWQIGVSNLGFSGGTLSLSLDASIFDDYVVDDLVAFDATDPGSDWIYLTRTSNVVQLEVPPMDVRILKLGVPVEALGCPQPEDGYTSDVLYNSLPIGFSSYDSQSNQADILLDSCLSQFVVMYAPPGGSASLTVNGQNPAHFLSSGDPSDLVGTNDYPCLVAYVPPTRGTSPDNTPPSVEVQSPASGDTLSVGTEITVESTVSDHPDYGSWGISRVNLYVDSELVDTCTDFPYDLVWTASAPSESTTLTVQALDDAGNIGYSEPVAVSVISDYAESLEWWNAVLGDISLSDGGQYGEYFVEFTYSGSSADVGLGHAGGDFLEYAEDNLSFDYRSNQPFMVQLRDVPPSYNPFHHGAVIRSASFQPSSTWSTGALDLSSITSEDRERATHLLWFFDYKSNIDLDLDRVRFDQSAQQSGQEPDPTDGATPSYFIQSTIKSDGGYGLYGNDVSTLYHDCYGVMSSLICGTSPPSGIADKIRSQVEPSMGEFPLMADLAVSALAAMGETLPCIADELDALSGMSLDNHYRRVHALSQYGLEPSDAAGLVQDLSSNANPDGGYERDPIGEGLSSLSGFEDQRSCVWRTHHVGMILHDLGEGIPSSALNYILSVQNGDGGWGYEEGRESDLYPTWCAVDLLTAGGVTVPSDALSFLISCQNQDGGFGDRPGWESRLESTFYALDILRLLGEDTNPQSDAAADAAPAWAGDASYHAYSIHLQIGNGNYPGERDSPGFLIAGAEKMGISLVGSKNPSSDWLSCANGFADQYGIPVTAINGDEIYPFKLHYNGYHWRDHSHGSAHPVGTAGPWAPYMSGSTMGNDYDEMVVHNADYLTYGISYYPIYYSTPRVRDVLDASVELGGYNGLCLQGYDLWNSAVKWPVVEKYRGLLAPMTESDNHHVCNGWSGFGRASVGRTFFIAQSDDWAGFFDAVQNGRAGYVRNDGFVYGSRWFIDWVRDHPGETTDRLGYWPEFLMVPITSENSFEWGRYSWESWQGGLAIRLWTRTEILELRIDGQPQDLSYKSALDCAEDAGHSESYYEPYWYLERPDLTGTHTIQVDYVDGAGATRTEVWEVQV
jgi:hypothetical protein